MPEKSPTQPFEQLISVFGMVYGQHSQIILGGVDRSGCQVYSAITTAEGSLNPSEYDKRFTVDDTSGVSPIGLRKVFKVMNEGDMQLTIAYV